MNPMLDFSPARKYLIKATSARGVGLEGQSRVLCRMAAASAIKTYLGLKGQPGPVGNVYEGILAFSQTGLLPSNVRDSLGRLLMRVDQDYNLPDGIDLIADVEQLLVYLETE